MIAPAGQAQAEQVVAATHEVGFEQRGQLAPEFVRQLFLVERLDRLTGRVALWVEWSGQQ